MILILVMYFFWALLIFLNQKIMFVCAHPFFIGGLRSFSVGLLFLLYNFVFCKIDIKRNVLFKSDFKLLFSFGIVVYCFAVSGFVLGLEYLSPVIASFLFATGPFLTTLLMYFLKKESISIRKIYGLLIGFCAIVPVVLSISGKARESSVYGAIVFFASMILYSYGWILFKDILSRSSHSSSFLNGIAMSLGGAVALLISIIFKVPDESIKNLFMDHYFLTLVFIGVTAICYGLYAYLLTKHSPTVLSFAGFLGPFYGMLISVFFFGNQFSIIFVFSLLALFLGFYIFYQEELKKI